MKNKMFELKFKNGSYSGAINKETVNQYLLYWQDRGENPIVIELTQSVLNARELNEIEIAESSVNA